MAIIGQNTLLNQYVPTFYIKNLLDNQMLIYDSVRRAFVNVDIVTATSSVNHLGQLTDVSPTVDNPIYRTNGQALVYNSFTQLWQNTFVDYDTLLHKPTSSNFSFAGLSDTTTSPLPNGYVLWNSIGTQLVYSATIPATSITGLATVATSGDYNDLIHTPVLGTGTVTSVSVVSAHGISGTVASPTVTPTITLTLGAITPTSVVAAGIVTGSNLSGTNTGNQTITLTGDVIGTGTGSFGTTLANSGVTIGTYGSSSLIPIINVDAKGRIIGISTVTILSGAGTVTSADVSGGITGLTTTGGPILTSGVITLQGTLNVAHGGTGATTVSNAINGLLPPQSGHSGYVLTTDGSALSWTSVAGTGTVTHVGATGSTGIIVGGSPIMSSGILTFDLASSGVIPGSYINSNITVDTFGRVISAANGAASVGITETVVFQYSAGGGGNFSGGQPISYTSGVAVTIVDAANCVATYAFTGKLTPPKSIITYGQAYSMNTFLMHDTTSLPTAIIAGGGTAAFPDLANGIFSASNIVTLQTRMSDTGASAGLGQRAWLVIVFGF